MPDLNQTHHTTPTPGALIGIFWLYHDSLFATFPIEPSPGNETEVSFDSNESHYHAWELLRTEGRLDVLPRVIRHGN